MATPQEVFVNFERYNTITNQGPWGVGVLNLAGQTGSFKIKFTADLNCFLAIMQNNEKAASAVVPYIFDPNDFTKFARYNSSIFTATASTTSNNYAIFPAGEYTISLETRDWTFSTGFNGFTDGLAICFVSDRWSKHWPSVENPGGHLAPDETYWCFQVIPVTNIQYSKQVMVERFANSIDSCPIFAERSANDANGDNIEETYLKRADEQVYTAGAGLNETTLLPSGEYEFSWAYTVGRNLHINQDNAIQTKLPGGTLDPSSTSWQAIGDFAGAYRMLARANGDGTYDLGVSYFGQGASSTFTIIGQQIVAEPSSTTLTITKCNYINEPVDNLGTRIGSHFDPATMQSLTIEGHAYIGPLSDFRATLWTDGTTVHAAFSAIEVGTVGATN